MVEEDERVRLHADLRVAAESFADAVQRELPEFVLDHYSLVVNLPTPADLVAGARAKFTSKARVGWERATWLRILPVGSARGCRSRLRLGAR